MRNSGFAEEYLSLILYGPDAGGRSKGIVEITRDEFVVDDASLAPSCPVAAAMVGKRPVKSLCVAKESRAIVGDATKPTSSTADATAPKWVADFTYICRLD